jgi:site-specific recombinase XerD
MRRKTVFKPPVLKDRGGDLSKDWYIEIQFRDPRSDVLIRQRFSEGLNFILDTDDETRKERYVIAKKKILALEKKIKAGWTPVADYEIEFIDSLEYHNAAEVYGRLKKSKRTIRFVASKFFDDVRPRCKPKSYNSYLSKCRLLVSWCELNKLSDLDISCITQKNIQDFFVFLCTEKNLDKLTVKKYKQNIHAMFDFAIKQKFVKENPCVDVMIPVKKVDNAARPFIQTDIERFLNAIEFKEPQLYLACMFQYYAAIRPGTELRLLKIEDLDLYNGSVTMNDIDSKKERHETVDMPVQLKKLCIERYQLQTYQPDFYIFGRNRCPGPEAMGQNTMRDRFNRYRDALGFSQKYKYYSFKHTGAGNLLESGATLVEVQKHLRHKDISDTQAYVRRHFGERNDKVINHFPDPVVKRIKAIDFPKPGLN